MELEELQWFIRLSQLEHLTATAREIRVTPSTLSRSLQRLEEDIGVPLFDRRGRRLVLNENGRRYLVFANTTVTNYVGLKSDLSLFQDPSSGQVKVAFLFSLGPWILENLVVPYHQSHLGVGFALLGGNPEKIQEFIEKGEAYFGILATRLPSPEYRWHTLYRETLCLTALPDHPLAAMKRISTDDLRDQQFILGRPDSALRSRVEKLCLSSGFAPKVAFEGHEMATIQGLVEAGLGVSIMAPSHIHNASTDLVFVPIDGDDAIWECGLAWMTHRPLSAPAKQFLEYAIEHRFTFDPPKGKLSSLNRKRSHDTELLEG